MLPDACCMWGFLLCSFPELMAMVIGANSLVSLSWDRDLKEYSKGAAEIPFVWGGSLSSLPNMDYLFSLFVGGRKMCVCSSV